jgi:carbon storage regulator
MLILSRKEGQQIDVGAFLTVTVLEISEKSVKLGFDAPKHISINRTELTKKVEEELIEFLTKDENSKNKE